MLELLVTPNTIELKQPKVEIPIVHKIQTNRNEYFLTQVTSKDKPNKKTQTIEIPAGYKVILCHEDYVCIPKNVYNAQPVVPSTINQAPQATIANPNPNQQPSQNFNQINQNVNPGIGQINSQPNQYPGGYNPNQGISSPNGQPGGIGIGQQNIGTGSGGNYGGGYNGGIQPGKINTNINLGINMGVSW
jgi:hypothetical protein